MNKLIVNAKEVQGGLHGQVRVPGDKSISHRSLLLGSLAGGVTHVSGFLPGGDCQATLHCMRALGVEIISHDETTLTIHGPGLHGLQHSAEPLNCVRSGTTMRLLTGIMAGQAFDSILTGEEQLLKRPMRRVADPLALMGAQIETNDGRAPLHIKSSALHGYEHTLAVASAQVKSALLLAGLYADGITTVHQPGPSRDHTERMLSAMGADLKTEGLSVTIAPVDELGALDIEVPGDISSAAFPLVAALLVPGSEVVIHNVGTNTTRTGILEVLAAMGADIEMQKEHDSGGEPVADLLVRASGLKGVEVGGDTVVRMIDEFPILAVAATQAEGVTLVRDAAELRVKETDRIATVVEELQKMGAHIEAREDGFVVEGPTVLKASQVNSHGDHRLGMALAVAGLAAAGEVVVEDVQCVSDSYPGFIGQMQTLGAHYA